MTEYQSNRFLAILGVIAMCACILIVSARVERLRASVDAIEERVIEQVYRQTWEQVRANGKIACALRVVPMESGDNIRPPRPNYSLQAECEIKGTSTSESAITDTPVTDIEHVDEAEQT